MAPFYLLRLFTRGGWVFKKGQNSVHVIIEWPLTWEGLINVLWLGIYLNQPQPTVILSLGRRGSWNSYLDVGPKEIDSFSFSNVFLHFFSSYIQRIPWGKFVARVNFKNDPICSFLIWQNVWILQLFPWVVLHLRYASRNALQKLR